MQTQSGSVEGNLNDCLQKYDDEISSAILGVFIAMVLTGTTKLTVGEDVEEVLHGLNIRYTHNGTTATFEILD